MDCGCVEAGVASAVASGQSCLVVVTEALRALGLIPSFARPRVLSRGLFTALGRSTLMCELRSWGKRLGLARGARAHGEDVYGYACRTLFHPRTGLRRCGAEASSSDEAWGILIRRVRRQLRRAAAIKHARVFAPERSLVERCDEVDSMGDDPTGRAAAVWRILSARGPNLTLNKLYPLDDIFADPVFSEDDRFAQTAADIGAHSVNKMDEGTVYNAFLAWCSVFKVRFEEVMGSDGGEWKLPKELTFALFCKVVRRMPSGKAVGQGGFSIELLRAADESVLWLFYTAMMTDLARGVLSPNWPVVLYMYRRH